MKFSTRKLLALGICLIPCSLAYANAEIANSSGSPFDAVGSQLVNTIAMLGLPAGALLLILALFQGFRGEPNCIPNIIAATALFSMPTMVSILFGPIDAPLPDDDGGIPWGWVLSGLALVAVLIAKIFRRQLQGALANTRSAPQLEPVEELRQQQQSDTKPCQKAETLSNPGLPHEPTKSIDIDKRKRKVILD